jgi:hypothetical protein
MKRNTEPYKDRAPDEFNVEEELYPFQKKLEPVTSPIFGISFWRIVIALGLALALLILTQSF